MCVTRMERGAARAVVRRGVTTTRSGWSTVVARAYMEWITTCNNIISLSLSVVIALFSTDERDLNSVLTDGSVLQWWC
jgi:hypothetical protein